MREARNTALIGLVAGGRPPAKLHQVSLSHTRYSFERPFTCPVDDCNSSYRRKDHLNRHLLQHEGKLFDCPFADCKSRFTVPSNIARHVKDFHGESTSPSVKHPKEHVCAEPGCGKSFQYPSQLQKHVDSHVKLESVESFCAEPDCMKYFTNEQCLKEHIRSCHQHIICHICDTKQLKKNIKRHMRMHEGEVSTQRIKCSFEGCSLTFSTTSNLNQHIKAVHFELTPFSCSIPGCHVIFAFKHVRDNHEKSGHHVFTPSLMNSFNQGQEAVPKESTRSLRR